MGLFERLRPHPGWKDPDPQVRRAAAHKLADPVALAELYRSDPDGMVREAAAAALLYLALEGPDEEAATLALETLEDPKLLVQVARSALHESLSRAALQRLHDHKALGSIARHARHAPARLDALERLVDFHAPAAVIREELRAISLKSPHDDAALSALEHLTGSERFALRGDAAGSAASGPPEADFLNDLAAHGKSRAVARRARSLLHHRQELDAIPKTDRRRQLRLCEEAESLARSPECEPLLARIAAIQDTWTDLVPRVDDDLDERFQAAIQAARERHRRNLAAREERMRKEAHAGALRDRHVAPRLVLIASVEAAAGEETPRLLDDACWEWNRLESPDARAAADPIEELVLSETRVLGERFDEARKTAQCRYEKWIQDREQARLLEVEGEARRAVELKRQEQAKEERSSLARLEKLCERAERALRGASLSLKKADPVLRDVKGAIEALPPLPTRRDHERILERLKAARSALGPRVQELREGEKWKRWANTNVQEELCARAEGILEIADPEAAARLVPDLLERWKAAAEAEPDRSQTLWQRFKTATDSARARLEALHAQNAARKLALCEQAEALAGSTDWIRTGEAIKGLQGEWKGVGQAGRGQEKALWERFRKACDVFFRARDENRARRKDEWARNLEAREALCARAEALADSTDWRTAAAELKTMQTDWKGIGPVRPNRSEEIWKRFRTACDRFFERYKRRDQIDREAHLARREAICRELEALLPLPAGPASATPAEVAQDTPPGTDATPADLLTTLESAWARWQNSPPLPREHAAPLVERFERALDGLAEARAGAVRGTPFDAGANRLKMEELCGRVERLLSGPAADESLSPATRLATMLREALASNTIGGKVAEETKQRAAAEEVRKAQAAWQRIGYVPENERRVLTERFERACNRLQPRTDRKTPAPARVGAAGGRRSRA